MTTCVFLNIQVDATEDEPTSFIYQSPDALSNPSKLLVLIQGSGVVRAGQWARRLIINQDLDSGTQIPFITRAMEVRGTTKEVQATLKCFSDLWSKSCFHVSESEEWDECTADTVHIMLEEVIYYAAKSKFFTFIFSVFVFPSQWV